MNEWLGREITSLNLHSSIVNTEKIHGCHLLNVTEKLCKSAMNCRNGEIKDITSPRKLLHDEEFTSKFLITQRNFHIHLKKSLSMLLKSIEGQSHLPAVVVSHTADCQKKYEKQRDEELGMSINVGKFFFSSFRFSLFALRRRASHDKKVPSMSLDVKFSSSSRTFQTGYLETSRCCRVKVTSKDDDGMRWWHFQLVEHSLRRLDFITHSAAIEIYRNEFDVV